MNRNKTAIRIFALVLAIVMLLTLASSFIGFF